MSFQWVWGKKIKKKGKRGKGRGKKKGKEKGKERGKEREKGRGKGKRGERKGKRGKEREKEREKKSQGGRDLEVDLFRAPKHFIILLKSKKILCKGGSAPLHPPPPNKLLRSLRGHQKPVKYTGF